MLNWSDRKNLWIIRWKPDALLFLAKQPEDLRWALMHGRQTKAVVDLRGLNWEAFHSAKHSLSARREFLPAQAMWERLTGVPWGGGYALPCLKGFKFKTFNRLCVEFGVSPKNTKQGSVGGWLLPFIHLVRLFGDYESIRRFVTTSNEWTLQGLHDAGQFRLPSELEKWTPARWAPLCLRHPRAVEFSMHFPKLEKRCRRLPSSFHELQLAVLKLGYTGVTKEWFALAKICLEAKMSDREFNGYKSFWHKVARKPADFMPHVDVIGDQIGLDGWRFRKLPEDDFRGPMLGVLTGCCQHLVGAGSSCAIHGVTSPYSAFYVVERNGRLVAQCWAWRTMNGGVVLDSIEAIDRSEVVVKAVSQLLSAAKRQFLIKSLGIVSFYLGDTRSGITGSVLEQLQVAQKTYSETPVDACRYYDGRTHRLLGGRPHKRAQSLPAVIGYIPLQIPYQPRVELVDDLTEGLGADIVHMEIDRLTLMHKIFGRMARDDEKYSDVLSE